MFTFQWSQDPFICDKDSINDDEFPEKEHLSEQGLENRISLDGLRGVLNSEDKGHAYTLARQALGILTSFSFTYRCKQGFSNVLRMKTKKRNQLKVSCDRVIREYPSAKQTQN